MKKTLLTIILCVTYFNVNAQNGRLINDPFITGMWNFTVSGSYVGATVGVKVFERWSVEGFYQALVKVSDIPFEIKQHTWGSYVGFTFFRNGVLNADIQVRGGFSNTRFFIVWPALLLNVKIGENFSGFIVNTVRFESPSIGFGVKYDLFK